MPHKEAVRTHVIYLKNAASTIYKAVPQRPRNPHHFTSPTGLISYIQTTMQTVRIVLVDNAACMSADVSLTQEIQVPVSANCGNDNCSCGADWYVLVLEYKCHF
jgi:hypothetical protein